MSDIVTAGILVIGDEILSGRTKDKNIGFIAEYLTNIGIDLKEVRVVADEEADIIAALDALRGRYTYVFTTGGIGPTHDDITADSVAKAFGVGIDHHPEVVARFRERFQGAGELNEARLRMARIPDGAELIQSATILAPGFKIGNVIVMAGVPSIMQAMMDIVAPKLKSGVRMLSESVRANAREGDIGGPLREIANAHPDTIIGSYPFQDEDKKPNTNLVVRSRDPEKLNAAMNAVKEMLAGIERGPVATIIAGERAASWTRIRSSGKSSMAGCRRRPARRRWASSSSRSTASAAPSKSNSRQAGISQSGGQRAGRISAAMLDDTMGPALTATLDAGEFAPTVNLNVQFHRPAKAGPLKGVGRVVLRGKEICQLSSELFQNDKIVATATATAVIRKM